MTVQELITKAERHGFKVADIVTGAKLYHNQPNIHRLTPEQVADLDRRITARIERTRAAQETLETAKQIANASNGTRTTQQAARNVRRA
jgi:hypothetical protein